MRVTCRPVQPADWPALNALTAGERRPGADALGVEPSRFDHQSDGLYIYEISGRPAGFACLAFPKPGEAWLRAKRVAPTYAGADVAGELLLRDLEQAGRRGAQVLRLGIPVPDVQMDPDVAEQLGFRRVVEWWLSEDARVVATNDASIAPPRAALRARRFSAGQWHNPRVRLALQAALERCLPASVRAGGGGTLAPWGLIAHPTDPSLLMSFGPFDLVSAVNEREVVAAGDPANPVGLMLLREPERSAAARPFQLRFFGALPAARATLLAYVAERARALGDAPIVVSLPADAAAPLIEELGWRGRTFSVYERAIIPAALGPGTEKATERPMER